MKRVYFDHDGGVDDTLSLVMLLQAERRGLIELIGVGVVSADCYLATALATTLKVLKMFNRFSIPVGATEERGVNPFPHEWRVQRFDFRYDVWFVRLLLL